MLNSTIEFAGAKSMEKGLWASNNKKKMIQLTDQCLQSIVEYGIRFNEFKFNHFVWIFLSFLRRACGKKCVNEQWAVIAKSPFTKCSNFLSISSVSALWNDSLHLCFAQLSRILTSGQQLMRKSMATRNQQFQAEHAINWRRVGISCKNNTSFSIFFLSSFFDILEISEFHWSEYVIFMEDAGDFAGKKRVEFFGYNHIRFSFAPSS